MVTAAAEAAEAEEAPVAVLSAVMGGVVGILLVIFVVLKAMGLFGSETISITVKEIEMIIYGFWGLFCLDLWISNMGFLSFFPSSCFS